MNFKKVNSFLFHYTVPCIKSSPLKPPYSRVKLIIFSSLSWIILLDYLIMIAGFKHVIWQELLGFFDNSWSINASSDLISFDQSYDCNQTKPATLSILKKWGRRSPIETGSIGPVHLFIIIRAQLLTDRPVSTWNDIAEQDRTRVQMRDVEQCRTKYFCFDKILAHVVHRCILYMNKKIL